jgi:uncharacterized iron-regulated protein
VLRFNIYGDSRITVAVGLNQLMWLFYSQQLHDELHSIGNRARTNFLEAACCISFISDYTSKQLFITVEVKTALFIPGT